MPRVPGIAIFVLIATLVIANLIALLFYTNYTKYEQGLAGTDEVISQLFNTLYLMNQEPRFKWDKILQISETPEVKMSISHFPLYKHIIHASSMKDLHHQLHYATDRFQVSLQLTTNDFLNVNYHSKSTVELMQIFIITLASVVAFALLFSAWTLLRFTRPLREFKKAAEQLGVSLGSNPVIEYGPAIVKETAYAMDQMQQRIQKLLKDKNLMLAAISHDLRSPITRLKLRTQFITDQDQAAEWSNDLDEMEAMIDQILIYTKDVAKTEEFTDIDLISLIFAISDEYAEQGYIINCHSQILRQPFRGRRLALKRAFNNIIANATKYAKETSIHIDYCGNHLHIIIRDDGPGIPETLLKKVFTAFYRVDNARTANKGGTGLGLAITQDIIFAHKGTIELKNLSPHGLEVSVKLPLSC